MKGLNTALSNLDESLRFKLWFLNMLDEERKAGNYTACSMAAHLEGVYQIGWMACAKQRDSEIAPATDEQGAGS